MAEVALQKAELAPLLEGPVDDPATKLARANDQALDYVSAFFDYAHGEGFEDRKLTQQANTLALGVITRQIRVDDGRWRQGALDVVGELLREIQAAREGKPAGAVIEGEQK